MIGGEVSSKQWIQGRGEDKLLACHSGDQKSGDDLEGHLPLNSCLALSHDCEENGSALRGVEDDETFEVVAVETPITSKKTVCLKPSQILNDLVAGAGFLDNSVDTLNRILDDLGSNQPSSFILEIDYLAGAESELVPQRLGDCHLPLL